MSASPPTVEGVTLSSTEWSAEFLEVVQASPDKTSGYEIPTGSTAQAAALPWTNLNQIKIDFSEDVKVDKSDLALSGINNVSYLASSFRYDAFSHVATWTFPNSFSDDRYFIDLDGDGLDPVEDFDGYALDGEWTDEVSTYSSGDGTAGGDFEFSFNILPADGYVSGRVDYFDYLYIRALDGLTPADPGFIASYDLDGDGTIDSTDWMEPFSNLWVVLPTGTPAGNSNDAPSSAAIPLIDIDDHAIDVAISLFDSFEDLEDTDSQLSFQVVNNSDPSLLDTLSINSSTGELTISTANGVSGRTHVLVRATDTLGLSAETEIIVDVDRDNLPPNISNYFAQEDEEDTWVISGYVSDPDDDLDGLIVSFWGVFETRASVDENGYFEFAVILDNHTAGFEWAEVVDSGLMSDTAATWISLT